MWKYRKSVKFSYPGTGGVSVSPVEITNYDSAIADTGKVVYDVPSKLDMLLSMHIAENQGEDMEGWRIQIYAGGDLKKANEVRADFVEIHEEVTTYRRWVQPTFRIRVGDFVSRNDAIAFCNELRIDFPGAFVVPDRIKKPKSKREKMLREKELMELEEKMLLENGEDIFIKEFEGTDSLGTKMPGEPDRND